MNKIEKIVLAVVLVVSLIVANHISYTSYLSDKMMYGNQTAISEDERVMLINFSIVIWAMFWLSIFGGAYAIYTVRSSKVQKQN